MKKVLKYISILFLLLIVVGCVNIFQLSDITPDNVKFPNDENKARTLLKEMGDAHGITYWDSIETYNVKYRDEFYGFLGKQSHPFKEQNMLFSLSFIPKTFNGQMEIATGKEKGTIWGIQEGQTYRLDDSSKVVIDNNKDIKFWIPTYQYFVELPSRIQEVTAADYIGTQVINGVNTEGVLVSWGTVEPQKDLDQYIIWMNSETKVIVKAEYTVRDAYKFVAGAAYYNDYRNYNGLLLPSVMPVESNLLRSGYLHQMSIESFTINPVNRTSLLPL